MQHTSNRVRALLLHSTQHTLVKLPYEYRLVPGTTNVQQVLLRGITVAKRGASRRAVLSTHERTQIRGAPTVYCKQHMATELLGTLSGTRPSLLSTDPGPWALGVRPDVVEYGYYSWVNDTRCMVHTPTAESTLVQTMCTSMISTTHRTPR